MSRYYGKNWPRISREIKARDGFRCQMHGSECEWLTLLTHHIAPIEDFNGDLERANDPSNLITLCALGHQVAHRIMGRR